MVLDSDHGKQERKPCDFRELQRRSPSRNSIRVLSSAILKTGQSSLRLYTAPYIHSRDRTVKKFVIRNLVNVFPQFSNLAFHLNHCRDGAGCACKSRSTFHEVKCFRPSGRSFFSQYVMGDFFKCKLCPATTLFRVEGHKISVLNSILAIICFCYAFAEIRIGILQ
jgi:hypothetical protein